MKHIMSKATTSELTNVKPEDVQPNAVDLRIDKVFRIHSDIFEISEENKIHRGKLEINPNQDGVWFLAMGDYEVIMENIIKVGEDEAGWVITRSTLNRNGVFLTSGLYDSGYHGMMAAVMHVGCGPIKIKKGTRIGQYLNFKAEALHKYEGSYGLHSEHDKKYQGET